MNCPLCKKLLLEIEVHDATDFVCSESVKYGKNSIISHFEWNHDEGYYRIRVPPYVLLVGDDSSFICSASDSISEGIYAHGIICALNSINKKNIDEFAADYKYLGQKLDRLVLFS